MEHGKPVAVPLLIHVTRVEGAAAVPGRERVQVIVERVVRVRLMQRLRRLQRKKLHWWVLAKSVRGTIGLRLQKGFNRPYGCVFAWVFGCYTAQRGEYPWLLAQDEMRVSFSACADWPRALQKHKEHISLKNFTTNCSLRHAGCEASTFTNTHVPFIATARATPGT